MIFCSFRFFFLGSVRRHRFLAGRIPAGGFRALTNRNEWAIWDPTSGPTTSFFPPPKSIQVSDPPPLLAMLCPPRWAGQSNELLTKLRGLQEWEFRVANKKSTSSSSRVDKTTFIRTAVCANGIQPCLASRRNTSQAGFICTHPILSALPHCLPLFPAAAIYYQHFQVDRDIIKDMLLQKYKAYPASMNWQSARTIVLKLHTKIVAYGLRRPLPPPPTMLLSSKCPAVPRLWAPRDVAGPAPSATTRSSASWRWRCLPPTEVCPSPLWSDAPQLAVAGLCPPPSPRRLREARAGGAAVGLCAAEVLRVPVQQSSPQVAIFFASRTLPLFFLSAFCAQGQNCSRKEKQSSTTSHFLLFERLESKEEIVR